MSTASRQEIIARSAAGLQQTEVPRETLRAHDPNTDGPHGHPYAPSADDNSLDPLLRSNNA